MEAYYIAQVQMAVKFRLEKEKREQEKLDKLKYNNTKKFFTYNEIYSCN
jgi:hypothetical protein